MSLTKRQPSQLGLARPYNGKYVSPKVETHELFKRKVSHAVSPSIKVQIVDAQAAVSNLTNSN